ncbi:MAG TPA: hypothetical protein VFI23_15130 [Rhizomicrobium sp.]|nr:hypothetical protein [Rhizomicrobium sp.]
MIFIFSSPRSGSTWLAKAFDSHPDTLYLHEPDIVDRGSDLLPHWFAGDAGGFEDRARQYLTRLSGNRSLRTVGTRPFFAKHYRAGAARAMRTGLIYAGKGLEKAGFTSLSSGMTIPDLAKPDFARRTVIKSVSALGRADALVSCGEAVSAVLLLRHPCAYVNSYLTGNRMGVMPPPRRLGRLLETRSARRLNAARAVGTADNMVAQLTWEWLLANSEGHAAMIRSGGTLMRYEDLALNPEAELRPLFAKLGLEWSPATSHFLKSSQGGDGSYYSLARDPAEAISKWKRQMEPAQIETVRRIACLDPVGQRYFTGQD